MKDYLRECRLSMLRDKLQHEWFIELCRVKTRGGLWRVLTRG